MMLKHIKSLGISGKKVKKIKSLPAETKMAENDYDILNMVRKINLDSLGASANFEVSNGHDHALSKKGLKDPEHATGVKRKTEETAPIPVPKHRRSSSSNGKLRLSTSTLKASRRTSGEYSHGARLLLDAEVSPDTDNKNMQRIMVEDLLLSSLKRKVKGSETESHNAELNDHDEHDMKVQSYCQIDLY